MNDPDDTLDRIYREVQLCIEESKKELEECAYEREARYWSGFLDAMKRIDEILIRE